MFRFGRGWKHKGWTNYSRGIKISTNNIKKPQNTDFHWFETPEDSWFQSICVKEMGVTESGSSSGTIEGKPFVYYSVNKRNDLDWDYYLVEDGRLKNLISRWFFNK